MIQRVARASVSVEGEVVGQIGPGVLLLLGIHPKDTREVARWMVDKVLNLRIFRDDTGKMNRSLLDVQGEVLVVSQFTLYGNCSRGRRPDFLESAPPEIAEPIYNQFLTEIRRALGQVECGIFGASMQVELVNDGPVTFLVERNQ